MDSANASAAKTVDPIEAASSNAAEKVTPLSPKISGETSEPVARKRPPGATDGVVKLATVSGVNATNANLKKIPSVARPANGLGTRAENIALQLSALVIVGALGWIIGANSFDRSRPDAAVVEAIRALDAKIEAVAARAASASDVALVRNGVDEISRGLETLGKTTTAVADLDTRVETVAKLQAVAQDQLSRDQTERFDQIAGRLEHLEKQATDPMPTASIHSQAAAAVPVSSASSSLQSPGAVTTSPLPPNSYVLRSVSGRFATIEGHNGLQRVARGDVIRGAGRVLAIRHRTQGWVVVTTHGVIDAAPY